METQSLFTPKNRIPDFNYTHKQINDNKTYFKRGNTINPDAINELYKILEFCKNNKIQVIGLLSSIQ